VIPGRSKVGYVRKTAAIVLAATFVVALAGCSDLPKTVDSCVSTIPSGNAASSISASGEFGGDPDAKVPTPTISKTVQIDAIHKGTGAVLGKYDVAMVQATVYDASTGKALTSTAGTAAYSKNTEQPANVGVKADLLGKDLACQRVGSRTASVLTAAQLFGSAATATSSGFTASQQLVIVTDIVSGYRGRATGDLQPLKSGFPSVVTAPDGTPGVTFDLQTAPKTLESETLRKGDGPVVKKGSTVVLQIQGIEWSNPPATTTFVSTWKTHQATIQPLSALDPGSIKSLVGQTAGSQILVVVPPKYGYPSGKAPQGYPTGSTLVFVYDILGVK
jgi:hypothetical protein